MKFFIMRHAESMATLNPSLFAERVPHEIPLTKEGHAQAKMAGEELKKYYKKNPERKLRVVYNEATRVLETKDEVSAVLQQYITTHVYDKRTEELDHGEFNSLTSKQMYETYPHIYEKYYYSGEDEKQLLESYKVKLPDGESKEDLFIRTKELIDDMKHTYAENEDVIFIGHGANCRAVEAVLTGKDGKWLAREFDSMGRTDIISIEINDGVVSAVDNFFKIPAKHAIQISDNPVKRIVIVGAGAAGTAVLANLIHKSPVGTEIIIFDQTATFGPGYTYDINLPPCFLLNRSIEGMHQLAMPPINKDKAGDNFFQWIGNNKTVILKSYSKWEELFPDSIEYLKNTLNHLDKEATVPRSLYGMYLNDCFVEYIKYAGTKGITVVQVSAKIAKIEKKSITWGGGGHSLQSVGFDYLILATGHWKKTKEAQYSNVHSFYDDPMILGFAPKYMLKIKGKTVLVKGTGLSAIDAAIMALELGAEKVTMFSRHGKLRALKGPWKERRIEYLTLENLEKLAANEANDANYFRLKHIFQLLAQELEGAGIKIDLQEAIYPTSPIKAALDELELCKNDKELLWRSVFESSFAIHQEIFTRLHPADKMVFLTEWLSFFMSYNSTVTVDSLERFLKYVELGRFEVRAGEADLKYDKNSEEFEARFAVKGQTLSIFSDIFINALGQDRKADYLPLVQSMSKVNMVSINPFGGVKTSETHNLIGGDGEIIDNIFVLGALACGDVLNFSGFDILYEISNKITDEIEKYGKVSMTNSKGLHFAYKGHTSDAVERNVQSGNIARIVKQDSEVSNDNIKVSGSLPPKF